ncbi:hypothetical protein QZH36_18595 [Erwinia sp. BC051422]|uniref:hypothetical protein n=1 Tax=Erwinia wuhanensis TaxID=3045167 RepID=UPI00264C726C|nr:hypothetical protein [Erwinia sp. BC051422]MDN8543415.1 hypothetical protein [Erwinia sp. BC051422]
MHYVAMHAARSRQQAATLVMRHAKLASSRLSPVRLNSCARRLLAGGIQKDVWL